MLYCLNCFREQIGDGEPVKSICGDCGSENWATDELDCARYLGIPVTSPATMQLVVNASKLLDKKLDGLYSILDLSRKEKPQDAIDEIVKLVNRLIEEK